MKRNKLFAVLLVLACVMTLLCKSSYTNAAVNKLTIKSDFNRVIEGDPGSTIHVKVPFQTVRPEDYVANPIVVTEYEDKAPFTTTSPKLTYENGQDSIQINNRDYTYVSFDVMMKDSAKIGNYDLKIQINFETYTGEGMEQQSETHLLSIRVSKEKEPAQISLSNVNYKEDSAAVGSKFDLSFTLANEGEIKAYNTYLTMDFGAGAEGAALGLVQDYATENVKVGDLASGASKKMTLPIKVLPTAKEGYVTLSVKLTYKDIDGNSYNEEKKILIQIKATSVAPTGDASLLLSSNDVNQEVLVGADFEISGIIENIGVKRATDIKITVPQGIGVESGILSNFKSDGITVPGIDAKSKTNYEVPLTVAKTASSGLKELSIQVSYKDSKGSVHTIVSKHYITVISLEEKEGELRISNIAQSPAAPNAGDKVSVSFVLENLGNKEVTDVSIGGRELSSMGFEPTSADADVRIGTIGAGEKQSVSLSLKAGSGIPEGLNPLKIGCSYKDPSGKTKTQEMTVYILNVQNNGNSKPKLIVSDFFSGSEELRAGSKFDFTFHLKNTHSTKAAKNIKVTISQKDNIFYASEGSNSFYIESIRPGEASENVIPMKVKSDTATGSYELSIAVEYEYDDMSKIDLEAGGVKDENIIKLQAVENSRPVIENINMGSMGVPIINQSTPMTFEFYNMGKSSLDNVYFTFEGDFQLETGEKLILGSVQPGNTEFVEPSLIPMVEGMAKGNIIIHFENSNGEEITVTKEIPETYVQAEEVFEDPGMYDEPAINENVSKTAKEILPLWLFLLIQAAVIIIVIPTTRTILIRMKKQQLMKQENKL